MKSVTSDEMESCDWLRRNFNCPLLSREGPALSRNGLALSRNGPALAAIHYEILKQKNSE